MSDIDQIDSAIKAVWHTYAIEPNYFICGERGIKAAWDFATGRKTSLSDFRRFYRPTIGKKPPRRIKVLHRRKTFKSWLKR